MLLSLRATKGWWFSLCLRAYRPSCVVRKVSSICPNNEPEALQMAHLVVMTICHWWQQVFLHYTDSKRINVSAVHVCPDINKCMVPIIGAAEQFIRCLCYQREVGFKIRSCLHRYPFSTSMPHRWLVVTRQKINLCWLRHAHAWIGNLRVPFCQEKRHAGLSVDVC